KDEDLGYITEPMFTQMKVEHLRQACRDRGIINHKGTRMFKAELVTLLEKWNYSFHRKFILNSSGDGEEYFFTDVRGAADAVLEQLKKAGFTFSEQPIESRSAVHPYLVQTQNNFDAERGCFNVHRAIVEYIKEKDPDVWKANETQPVEKQRPPPQSMNKHEYARLIHCYISPENMTQLESLTQSQYTQFIVFSAIFLPKGISCFHDSRIPNSVSYTYVV
ncbi:MAG: SAP domain-containing protein, partial [bacterium]